MDITHPACSYLQDTSVSKHLLLSTQRLPAPSGFALCVRALKVRWLCLPLTFGILV